MSFTAAPYSSRGLGNVVLFIAGGPGAGKSSILRQHPGLARGAQVVFDAILSDSNGVQRLVDQAREAGKDVSVVYVYRGPVDSYGSVLNRR